MGYFQKFAVAFDDGTEVEIQSSSRDLLGLEKVGVVLDDLPPIEASYRLAHVTLQRYKRVGLIDVDIPATADELMDLADLEPVGEVDAEGKGSAPDRPTGDS